MMIFSFIYSLKVYFTAGKNPFRRSDSAASDMSAVCVSGAFFQHGVRPGTRRRPLRDARGLLGGLQSLLWHFLFLPDDGDLPHRCEVQSGLQGADTQRVSLRVASISSESS